MIIVAVCRYQVTGIWFQDYMAFKTGYKEISFKNIKSTNENGTTNC